MLLDFQLILKSVGRGLNLPQTLGIQGKGWGIHQ